MGIVNQQSPTDRNTERGTSPTPPTGAELSVPKLTQTTDKRKGLAERVLLGLAAVWAILIIVGTGTLPLYSGASIESAGGAAPSITTTSATAVEVNGWWAFVITSIPLLVVVVVGLTLLARHPSRGTHPLAWVAVGVLGVVNVLALLSVGVFFLPVTGCLIAACIVRQARRTEFASSRPPA